MSGLDNMRSRFKVLGITKDGRNVKGKYKSFEGALKNSYQAEWITYEGKKYRCLINPDKLKQDYDQKIISIGFDAHMHAGSIFYWDRTGHYWLAYLQEYSEEAYFRSEIRRCDYEIDIDGEKTPVYVRGPVETQIEYDQKHKRVVNDLNYTLLMYLPKTPKNVEYFSRHQIVEFDGHAWQVVAKDAYTTSGILEVTLREHYDNDLLEEMIVPEIQTFEKNDIKKEPYIEGPQVIHPFDENIVYTIKYSSNGEFIVDNNKVKIIESDEKSCVVNVLTKKIGNFNLIYQVNGVAVFTLPVNIESF